mgnify:CR=1 FL=1
MFIYNIMKIENTQPEDDHHENSQQYNKEKLEYNKQLAVSIIAWIISISLVLYKHNKFKVIYNDIKNIGFSISLVIVIIFSVYCWHSKNQKLKLSAEKASFPIYHDWIWVLLRILSFSYFHSMHMMILFRITTTHYL